MPNRNYKNLKELELELELEHVACLAIIDLITCAKKGVINKKTHRTAEPMSHPACKTIFKSIPNWYHTRQRGGHINYQHNRLFTKISFQGHGKIRYLSEEREASSVKILQDYVNFFGNIIFAYREKNFKGGIDYKESAGRYNAWLKREDKEIEYQQVKAIKADGHGGWNILTKKN